MSHFLHRARKRFGQHFLVDQEIIARIVRAIRPQPTDALLEIGPGHGALTDSLLEHISALTLIEIDRDLVQQLREKYRGKSISLYEADALKFDYATLARDDTRWRLFGNLPYNISTPLLFHLLGYATMIHDMTFMLQKEIVDRLAASPGHATYGRLSVMIQYACHVTKLFDIAPEAFSPPPRVISSMVQLVPYTETTRPYPCAIHHEHFAHLVNTAFQHRRKTLKNALGKDFPSEAFALAKIDPQQRPETIHIEQYVKLSNFAHGKIT